MEKRNTNICSLLALLVGVIVVAFSCSDSIIGGGGVTRQLVKLQVSEIMCPGSFSQITLYPGNRAYVIFTEVSQSFACTTWTNDSSMATVQLIPGRYVVTAENGRGYGVKEMLDTLWVVPGDFTVVGSSDWWPNVLRMKDEDSILVIQVDAAYSDPDLIIAHYFYRNPADSFGIEAEQNYIYLLNDRIGGYLITDSMQHSIHEYMFSDCIAVNYSIPTTKELFAWRIQQAIDSVLTQFPQDFPSDSIWVVYPPSVICPDNDSETNHHRSNHARF